MAGRVDVARFGATDWSPDIAPGAARKLRWAWRAVHPSGNCVTGASAGTKAEATAAARKALQRLHWLGSGGIERPGSLRAV